MKIQTVLYYRYLLRQTIVMIITTLLVASVVCFLLWFSGFLRFDEKLKISLSIIICLLPLYTIVVFLIWVYKFNKSKSKLKNKELYKRITNQAVRDCVVKSRSRIKCLFISKNQEKEFFQIIEKEIEKQKKLLAIQKGEYK